ncbi:MAG TPA: type II toxin-antitoxin system RelE/ParE family toxin [Myxococcota bacterium]|nr:type II toxin-antitoxin system RelE/ParE family toxin [Myxococcota bacterium]
MNSFRIFETEQFARDLGAIKKAGRAGMAKKLRLLVYPQLRLRPHFGPHIKKLKSYKPDTWRYRIGNWRFFYEIYEDERIVFMTAAHHRGSAY